MSRTILIRVSVGLSLGDENYYYYYRGNKYNERGESSARSTKIKLMKIYNERLNRKISVWKIVVGQIAIISSCRFEKDIPFPTRKGDFGVE